jgi:hypothetical protein
VRRSWQWNPAVYGGGHDDPILIECARLLHPRRCAGLRLKLVELYDT